MRNRYNILFVLVFFLISPLSAKAWTNHFRFINHFNFPMILSIKPSLATVSSACGGEISHIDVDSRSASCKLTFEVAQKNWYDPYQNSGTITLAKTADPASYCVYNYSYTYSPIPYNYFDIHSEIVSLQACHGSLKSAEISVISDHTEALPRPLAGNWLLNAAKSTESFAHADCGIDGGDNCLIASPDLTTRYVEDGSTLSESLHLQTQLDRFEPLNAAQFIGSHNSAISRSYTKSTHDYNMSFADPDHFLSLTEQLNAGIRQLELDIEWYKNTIALCHDHVSHDLQDMLCEGNDSLISALKEIRTWIEKNPTDVVILYLDVNLPLKGYIKELDNTLALLEPYVFTPAMAQQYFNVSGNTLPFSQLTKESLVNRFKKNIIITNDNNITDTQLSQYVFVKVENSTTTPLYKTSLEKLLTLSCNGAEKYHTIKTLYPKDTEHYNLLRVNEDRTVINYLNTVDGKEPNQMTAYFTTRNIPSIAHCPVNIVATNMLGYSCTSTACKSHATDPRLYAFLWSWELGYPLTHGSKIAYINPATGHFANQPLVAETPYSVLCYRKKPSNPTEAFDWYLLTIQLSDVNKAFENAQLACKNSSGFFAAPTTSYWMNDVMSMVNAQGINGDLIIVNYNYKQGEWIPNIE
jgi:hypothetical protein